MGNRNIVAMLMIFSGLVGLVLSTFCLMSLVVSLVVTALISVVYIVEFNSVFVWLGLPLTVLMTLRWFYKNTAYVKSIVGG
ncbi:hypothetical protein ACK3BE_18260 [Pseudomonas mandelii]|uniref:hypothetical protein n=1 Tax=Pseudomonas mandelii TaxID=75612 RepID=UPI0028DAFB9F|nr:hypothetical protein [uncultured Pseudomonas sp.]